MLDAPLFSAMFSFVGIVYGLIVPLVIVQLLAVLVMSSMTNSEAKPSEIAQAVYCYVMMALGILLMSAGALPTIISVLAGVKLAGATYFTLLIIFAAGGVLFLWHDAIVRDVPDRSRKVTETIFIYLFKISGHLLVFLWSLSLVVTLLNGLPLEQGWWIMPLVMISYGGLFVWCTRAEDAPPLKQNLWSRLALPSSNSPTPKSTPWSPAKKIVKPVAGKQKVVKKTVKKPAPKNPPSPRLRRARKR